jgi:hypothetical protein
MMNNDRDRRIRERAYELWHRAGQPDGGADDFWRQAELLEERGVIGPQTIPSLESFEKRAESNSSVEPNSSKPN